MFDDESNDFDGPILIDDGVGSTAVPGPGYLGFGRADGASESSGPRIYAGTGAPDTVVTAPLGSLWIRTDAPGFFRNTDGATAWTAV